MRQGSLMQTLTHLSLVSPHLLVGFCLEYSKIDKLTRFYTLIFNFAGKTVEEMISLLPSPISKESVRNLMHYLPCLDEAFKDDKTMVSFTNVTKICRFCAIVLILFLAVCVADKFTS